MRTERRQTGERLKEGGKTARKQGKKRTTRTVARRKARKDKIQPKKPK